MIHAHNFSIHIYGHIVPITCVTIFREVLRVCKSRTFILRLNIRAYHIHAERKFEFRTNVVLLDNVKLRDT